MSSEEKQSRLSMMTNSEIGKDRQSGKRQPSSDGRFLKGIRATGVSLRRDFLTGLVVIIPISLTVTIVWLIFKWVAAILLPLLVGIPVLNAWPVNLVRLVSFIVTLVIVWVAGLLYRNLLGRGMIKWFEDLIGRIPFISNIYKALRQVTSSVLLQKHSYSEVVLAEYPRRGSWSIGFVTSPYRWRLGGAQGKQWKGIGLYIPTMPNPTSGYYIVVPESDIVKLNMSVEEAMRLIVSGGIVVPDEHAGKATSEETRQ